MFSRFVIAIVFSLMLACNAATLPKPLPPNVPNACLRAVQCEVVEDMAACEKCLESVADKIDSSELPNLDTVECEDIEAIAKLMRMPECAAEAWFGHIVHD